MEGWVKEANQWKTRSNQLEGQMFSMKEALEGMGKENVLLRERVEQMELQAQKMAQRVQQAEEEAY